MTLDWLDSFLPRLRCPATQQPLRLATVRERQTAMLDTDAPALACSDGTHIYPIVSGIPMLLASAAITTSTRP
jgi:uncharacterized protein YbaR (Trm112 family)